MSSLDPATRDLLAAIRDALDVPRPNSYADELAFNQVQRSRVMSVLGCLDAVLHPSPVRPETATEEIRARITELPVTYRLYEREAQDSPAEVTR